MNLWNANCDSVNPKSKRDLIRELDMWERTQGGISSGGGSTFVMRKDFDGTAWSTSHEDDYKKLIANARMKREMEMKQDVQEEQVDKQQQPEDEPGEQQQQQDGSENQPLDTAIDTLEVKSSQPESGGVPNAEDKINEVTMEDANASTEKMQNNTVPETQSPKTMAEETST